MKFGKFKNMTSSLTSRLWRMFSHPLHPRAGSSGFADSKIKFIIFLILILTAMFFRFWKVRDYVVFLGDEGRDMLVMRKMIMEKRPTFLGPTASVGGFYLGPIYYWMGAPFLYLWRYDPVGPSYMVAAFGALTVLLLFKFLAETAGYWPAILAGFLYATAPLIVRYSRSSWNPNPLPFFALLLFYFLYKGIQKKKVIYFLLAGACFGIAIQLHYLATVLFLLSTLVLFFNVSFKKWPIYLAAGLAGAIVTVLPFLLFEIKNNFPNFKTIWEFITRGSTVGYKRINLVWQASNTGNILLEFISELNKTIITKIFYWFLAVGGIYGLAKNWKFSEKKLIFSIGIIWFLGGLLGARLYAGQLFDYYFGFMFPAPFLLFGLVISVFWKNIFFRSFTFILTAITVAYFVSNGLFRYPPNRLIEQTSTVSGFVTKISEDKPFNFALIADHNSDHAYRYFLEIKGFRPTELETLVTEQLLVVCETRTCAPLGHPIWEIAGFGRAQIVGEWDLPEIGIKVFKLTHWPGAPNPAGKPAVKGG